MLSNLAPSHRNSSFLNLKNCKMRKSENCIINKYGAFGRAVFLIILSGCISTATIAQNIIVDESGDDMLDASTSSSGKTSQENQNRKPKQIFYNKSYEIIRSEIVFSHLPNSKIYFISYVKE